MIKKIWNAVGSVQVVVPLLIALTLASLAGIIVPQGLEPEQYHRAMGAIRSSIVLRLGFDHVFSAWWFYGLLGVLALNVVACSATRQLRSLRSASATRFLRSGKDAESMKFSTSWTSVATPDAIVRAGTSAMRKRLFASASRLDGGTAQVAARTRSFKEIGSLLFHTSILFFFAGGIVGMISGVSYMLDLEEGVAQPIQGEAALIRCDWFKLEQTQRGEIADYKSKLVVLSADSAPLASKVIEVNHPLSWNGYHFYQSSYGESAVRFGRATIRVYGKGMDMGGTTVDLPMDSAVTIPGTAVTVAITKFVCDFVIDVQSREVTTRSSKPNNPAIQVRVSSSDTGVTEKWIFKNYPDVHQKDDDAYQVTFVNYMPCYYTGIKMSKNPGEPFIWLGFACMTIGIMLVFYFPHRRFWVCVEPAAAGSSRIVLAGASSQPQSSLHDEGERVAADIKRALNEGAAS